jgi:hypothetical protein
MAIAYNTFKSKFCSWKCSSDAVLPFGPDDGSSSSGLSSSSSSALSLSSPSMVLSFHHQNLFQRTSLTELYFKAKIIF